MTKGAPTGRPPSPDLPACYRVFAEIPLVTEMLTSEIIPANWSNSYFVTSGFRIVRFVGQMYGAHGTTFSIRYLSKSIQQFTRSWPIRVLHCLIFASTFSVLPPTL